MRLGILGPAYGDHAALARAARVLRDDVGADKILYLGDDDALDQVIESWSRVLVGADGGEGAVFDRAAARCACADPQAIDAFVAAEEARLELRLFTSLPRGARTIELLDGRVVLFVFDKATLDEEDIVAASVLVFGKSPAPLVRKVGTRVFVSPGAVSDAQGGAAVLDDDAGGVRVDVLRAADGAVTSSEQIGQSRASKIIVQGPNG